MSKKLVSLTVNGKQYDVVVEPRELLIHTLRENLRLTVERIERLEEEKKEVADQIKDVYAEAKAMGYDTKALRQVVRLRKQDRQEREEQEAVLETYLIALGEV